MFIYTLRINVVLLLMNLKIFFEDFKIDFNEQLTNIKTCMYFIRFLLKDIRKSNYFMVIHVQAKLFMTQQNLIDLKVIDYELVLATEYFYELKQPFTHRPNVIENFCGKNEFFFVHKFFSGQFINICIIPIKL